MPQLNLEGGQEEPISEIVMAAIRKMATDGNYNDQDVARYLIRENLLPDWWKDGRLLIAVTTLVADTGTRRNSAGIPPSLKLQKPHQYRLRDWCSFEEKLGNLIDKIKLLNDDKHAIKLDASAIMREHPRHRKKVLAILPVDCRPSEK